MAEKNLVKPEIASQKKVVKLPPAIGDWTTYKPPKILVKRVKSGLYGFDRLGKEEIDHFLLIHYRFCQEFTRSLKIDLAMGIEFVACQVEQTTYLNFLRTLSGPMAQGKIAVAGLHEGIQFFCELNLANSLINHALGSQDTEPINRGLSDSEKSVFATSINHYLQSYSKYFENILPSPVYTFTGSPDIDLDRSINAAATFVAFSAEISVNDNPPEKIIFGFLGSTLKVLLKAYEEKHRARQLNFARLSPEALSRIKIPFSATLGSTTLLASEINQLEVGDVVALDQEINSAVELSIGDLLKLPVQPGASAKKTSVRIAGFGDEEVLIAPPALEEKEPEIEAASPEAAALPGQEEELSAEETEKDIFSEDTFEELPEEPLGTEEISEEPLEELAEEGTEEETEESTLGEDFGEEFTADEEKEE